MTNNAVCVDRNMVIPLEQVGIMQRGIKDEELQFVDELRDKTRLSKVQGQAFLAVIGRFKKYF